MRCSAGADFACVCCVLLVCPGLRAPMPSAINICRIAPPLPAQLAVRRRRGELLQGCGWGGWGEGLLRVARASLQLLLLLQPVRARVLSAAPPFVRCINSQAPFL